MIYKRSTALERSVKIVKLEGLNWFHGAKLTHSSDVDHDVWFARNTTNLSMHHHLEHVFDSRPKGGRFEAHQGHWAVSLSKTH